MDDCPDEYDEFSFGQLMDQSSGGCIRLRSVMDDDRILMCISLMQDETHDDDLDGVGL